MSGARIPTWKERENNKKRERRRRAISTKIFSGLRTYGNYQLPKHCDNNEVLKALANEAGWIVEPDGTTYRKGCKPPNPSCLGGSTSASPGSSHQPSSYASHNPSPPSSAIASPSSPSFSPNPHPDSLVPYLKNLSSSSSSSGLSKLPHLFIQPGSMSAPVTPPMTSPTARSPPRVPTDSAWVAPHFTYLPSSTSPNHDWFTGIQVPYNGPTSPTFSLVAVNPFGFSEPAVARVGPTSFDHNEDIPMVDVSDEFAFGGNVFRRVKPWEGERIHEEFGVDDLELTLGNPKTR